MHDVNPLSTVMHLKELDRQAMAKLRPLRSEGPARTVLALPPLARRWSRSCVVACQGAQR